MSGQHTPGPWLVNPLNARVEVPDADAPICELLWPTDLRSEDETFCNARLIAAAPELLEALRWLRAWWEPGSNHDTDEVKLGLAAADAALSKVTGS